MSQQVDVDKVTKNLREKHEVQLIHIRVTGPACHTEASNLPGSTEGTD